MKMVLVIVLALLVVALQSALLRWVGGGAFSLALPLAIVVYLGLNAGNVEGAISAAGVGYVVDLAAGGQKGLLTSLAVALFLFARIAGAAVDVRSVIGFVAVTAVGVFVYGAAALGFIDLVSPAESAPSAWLLGRVAAEALLTAAASPLLYAVMGRIDRLFAREDPSILRPVSR